MDTVAPRHTTTQYSAVKVVQPPQHPPQSHSTLSEGEAEEAEAAEDEADKAADAHQQLLILQQQRENAAALQQLLATISGAEHRSDRFLDLTHSRIRSVADLLRVRARAGEGEEEEEEGATPLSPATDEEVLKLWGSLVKIPNLKGDSGFLFLHLT